MLRRNLCVLSGLFFGYLGFAGQQVPDPGQQKPGNPGQQAPGQQNPAEPGQQKPEKPGQQQPGQQNPGQVYDCPKFGVQLSVMNYGQQQLVYIHRLTNEFGTLARLGLHNGDIIDSIAQQSMQTPQQVQEMMRRLEYQRQTSGYPLAVQLRIARNGQWYAWQATLN